MTLRLYNTLTRRKEEFRPLDAENLRVYVCGPTVYDFAHIGNARPVIVFDVLFRLLLHLAKQGTWDGGKGETKVTYVRNITDVDDKINARAARDYPDLPLNEAIGRVTEGTLRQFHADVAELGCLEPTVEPRATGHIDDMKAMIERLVEKDCAYVAEDHVLFHVAAMPDYGVLANRSLDEMLAGARVEVAPYKRDAMDFVLWKPSSPGEPAWPAPCGIETPGRPGWHIECSAMSWKHLGETFDIHGGGIDLMFPHHENELVQSRCALGVERMASVWMHNGFLQVEGRKMAKSEGNFVTIHDLLHTGAMGGRWPGEELRIAMLMTHYREPIDWTLSRLQEARSKRNRWLGPDKMRGVPEKGKVSAEFVSALSDDLNTIEAFSILDEMATQARTPGVSNSQEIANDLAATMLWLGIANDQDFAVSRAGSEDLRDDIRLAMLRDFAMSRAESEDLRDEIRAAMLRVDKEFIRERIAARNAARTARHFAEADRIRDELAAMGIELHDTKEGTSWEVRR